MIPFPPYREHVRKEAPCRSEVYRNRLSDPRSFSVCWTPCPHCKEFPRAQSDTVTTIFSVYASKTHLYENITLFQSATCSRVTFEGHPLNPLDYLL